MELKQIVTNPGVLKSEPKLNSEKGTGREFAIYTSRFSTVQDRTRRLTWQILVPEIFQPLISENSTVVDVGAGDGNFIRHIRAKRRIAVDLSEHVHELAKEGIEVLSIPATELTQYLPERVDVVVMSNFLEHLPTKRDLFDVLEEARKVLRADGKIIILQPNIKLIGHAYWDYVDHHIALTEKSLIEALEVSGFRIEKMIPAFLPYTAKSFFGHIVGGRFSFLVRWYLRLPFLWKLFGKQTLVVARPAR